MPETTITERERDIAREIETWIEVHAPMLAEDWLRLARYIIAAVNAPREGTVTVQQDDLARMIARIENGGPPTWDKENFAAFQRLKTVSDASPREEPSKE